jgi:hypothetical protein
LSLGCLYESIRIAASQFGWECELGHEFGSQNTLDFEVYFSPSTLPADSLASALPLRYTDRRVYKHSAWDSLLEQRLKAEAKDISKATVSFTTPVDEELTEYVLFTDSLVWKLKNYHRDLMRWIRFSLVEIKTHLDGMSWKTLGISFPESRILQLAKNWQVQELLNRMGFLFLLGKKTQKLLASSSSVYCVSVRSQKISDLFEAGRLSFRLWLRLNATGYGVQPLTLPSLLAYRSVVHGPAEELTVMQQEKILEGLKILRKSFRLNPSDIPVWMFRTGPVKQAEKSPRAPRLSLESVLEIVRG